MITRTRAWSAVVAAVVIIASVVTLVSAAAQAKPTSPAELRVDQAGYAAGSVKIAYLMLPGRVRQVSFSVAGPRGVVFRGVSGNDLGAWSSRYGAVYELNFTAVRRTGTYRIRVGSTLSPAFGIAPAAALYQKLVSNGVRYFTSERDGANVMPSVLGRKPANLADARANVYAAPKYDGNDNLIGGFTRIGGPVNVSGGWFDAGGGYEKFGYTTSYADALLLMAARDFRAAGLG